MRKSTTVLVHCLLLPCTAVGAAAQQAQNLSRQLANPIANLISVPWQSNADFDAGSANAFQYTLNIQPVIPTVLSPSWNMITRVIVPIAYRERLAPGDASFFGLSDVMHSTFFSPNRMEPLIWGAGPVLVYPTATSDQLGAEKWGVGPTVVSLRQTGPWTVGILANHVWSIAGDDTRSDVSATFLQSFVSHVSAGGVTVALNTESTYDWMLGQWSVPLNLTAARVLHIGRQAVSLGGGLRYFAEAPATAPSWGIRLIATALFPG